MSADMFVRTFYLRADTPLGVGDAVLAIEDLCQRAGIEELRILLEHGVIGMTPPGGAEEWTDDALIESIDVLRDRAREQVFRLFVAFRKSLTGRDVFRSRLSPMDAPGIDAFTTGGMSEDGVPTAAYAAWDIVFGDEQFPPDWPETIGGAAGLMHPSGAGLVVASVALRAWA